MPSSRLLSRRTFAGLALTALLGATPATAAPRPDDDPSCVQYGGGLFTAATICVEGDGWSLHVAVRASSLTPPTTLTVHSAELLELPPTGVGTGFTVVSACCWQGSATLDAVRYTSAAAWTGYGYRYRACATLTVRDGVGGDEGYGRVCSAVRTA